MKKSDGEVGGGGRIRFRATVELGGKTATGMEVPPDVVDRLGPTRRPAVTVTVNGHTYRSTVTPMGGRFLIPVSAEVRKQAGVAAGDEVDVDVELDTGPREVTVPADLAAALDQDAQAKAFFDGLSYSNRRWYTLWIESAKRAETRQARVVKAIGMLREGRKQG